MISLVVQLAHLMLHPSFHFSQNIIFMIPEGQFLSFSTASIYLKVPQPSKNTYQAYSSH